MKRIKTDKEIVVFIVNRDYACCECGEELFSGRYIHLSEKGAVCLACADLEHLNYLSRGKCGINPKGKKEIRIVSRCAPMGYI